MKNSCLLGFLFFYISFMSCTQAESDDPNEGYPQITPQADRTNLVFYEITPQTINGTWWDGQGFNFITGKIPDLKAMGVNCLWINPIQEGEGGGYWPYDHYAINDGLGTLDDIKRLVYEAHRNDMLVIIDLVINHFWIEHPYLVDVLENGTESPYVDFFLWEGDPGLSDYVTYPYDENLVLLNLDNAAPAEYVLDMTEYWMRELDIDGYRVDVAEKIEESYPGFSSRIRARMDTVKPEAILIAEGHVDDEAFSTSGYDIAYDWEVNTWQWGVDYRGYQGAFLVMFEDLSALSPRQLHDILTRDLSSRCLPLRFAENHDLDRAVSRWGIDGARIAHTIVFTSTGCPMLYGGSEVGFGPEDSGDEDYAQQNPVIWDYDHPLYGYLSRLIGIRRQYLCNSFSQIWVPNNNASVYSSLAVNGENRLLTIANFSNAGQSVQLDISGLSLGDISAVSDILYDEEISYDGSGTLNLTMVGFGTEILLLE